MIYRIARIDRRLTTETEPLDQLAIAVLILGLEIVEQLAPLVNHLQQTLTAMMIFFVLTEVLGKFGNPCRQQCYLYFRRTGVGFPAGVLRNDRAFCLTRQ